MNRETNVNFPFRPALTINSLGITRRKKNTDHPIIAKINVSNFITIYVAKKYD